MSDYLPASILANLLPGPKRVNDPEHGKPRTYTGQVSRGSSLPISWLAEHAYQKALVDIPLVYHFPVI